MKTCAVVQARMGSRRLPGKVLMELCGAPVLVHVLRRLQSVATLDRVVVATSTAPQDAPLLEVATAEGADVFRGSEDDVLARFHGAARGSDCVIRITADCPLLDPAVLGAMLAEFQQAADGVDYLSNSLVRTFPRGLDAEIFTYDALAAAHCEASSSYQREHVTPFIYDHPERFRLKQFVQDDDQSHHRWTLDTSADLELIRNVYEQLYDRDPLFGMDAVLALLEEQPELILINEHIAQKERPA